MTLDLNFPKPAETCNKCGKKIYPFWKCDDSKCNWCNYCNNDEALFAHKHCPGCLSGPRDQEVRDYDPMWKDGNVVCLKCGTKVRDYDAG